MILTLVRDVSSSILAWFLHLCILSVPLDPVVFNRYLQMQGNNYFKASISNDDVATLGYKDQFYVLKQAFFVNVINISRILLTRFLANQVLSARTTPLTPTPHPKFTLSSRAQLIASVFLLSFHFFISRCTLIIMFHCCVNAPQKDHNLAHFDGLCARCKHIVCLTVFITLCLYVSTY